MCVEYKKKKSFKSEKFDFFCQILDKPTGTGKGEKVKIGDRIKLANGDIGVVKFKGETDFTYGEVIGVELLAFNPNAHDGKVNDKRYFKAKQGKGYFTRKASIMDILPDLPKDVFFRSIVCVCDDSFCFLSDHPTSSSRL